MEKSKNELKNFSKAFPTKKIEKPQKSKKRHWRDYIDAPLPEMDATLVELKKAKDEPKSEAVKVFLFFVLFF